MFRIIRNDERYHFESDWLSTYWHFSFDHYFNPDNVEFGPLRVFNDDVVQPASGFPMHGHREMEIITYVLDGELEHKDSTGAVGRIGPGEVQRMSAGRGIRHSEYNPSEDKPVHLLQVWIKPSISGLDPGYEQRQFTREQRTGRLLAVASGSDNNGALKIHQDATFYVSALGENDRLSHPMAKGRRAYVFVIEGEVDINSNRLKGGDQARIEDEESLQISGVTRSELVLIDLP